MPWLVVCAPRLLLGGIVFLAPASSDHAALTETRKLELAEAFRHRQHGHIS